MEISKIIRDIKYEDPVKQIGQNIRNLETFIDARNSQIKFLIEAFCYGHCLSYRMMKINNLLRYLYNNPGKTKQELKIYGKYSVDFMDCIEIMTFLRRIGLIRYSYKKWYVTDLGESFLIKHFKVI